MEACFALAVASAVGTSWGGVVPSQNPTEAVAVVAVDVVAEVVIVERMVAVACHVHTNDHPSPCCHASYQASNQGHQHH